MTRAQFIRKLLVDGPCDLAGIRKACLEHGYAEPSAQAVYSAKQHTGERGGGPRIKKTK